MTRTNPSVAGRERSVARLKLRAWTVALRMVAAQKVGMYESPFMSRIKVRTAWQVCNPHGATRPHLSHTYRLSQ